MRSVCFLPMTKPFSPYIIDSHQDLAYNALGFGRDILRPAFETRAREQDTAVPARNGQTLLGWHEYQRGQVALIFSTVFLTPRRYAESWDTQAYREPADARAKIQQQIDHYRRLAGDHPDQFRLVQNRRDLAETLEPWQAQPARLPAAPESTQDAAEQEPTDTRTHPVGLMILMEGLEGIGAVEEMEDWWQMGVRAAGPVWRGERFCGDAHQSGGFTSEGLALLEVMAALGFTLDISHMNETSALQALDRYEGPVAATHANARALLKRTDNERHLTDRTIARLIERGGVMGVIPFNSFLRPGWRTGDDRQQVTLRTVAAHIDHICQIAGSALHAGLGTDFDGGFGWPAVPAEIDTIADLQKLVPILAEYGYDENSIANIFGENWRRSLERSLPDS